MTPLSIHLPSDASLAELSSKRTSDFKVNTPEMEEAQEITLADLYYSVHAAIQRILEPA